MESQPTPGQLHVLLILGDYSNADGVINNEIFKYGYPGGEGDPITTGSMLMYLHYLKGNGFVEYVPGHHKLTEKGMKVAKGEE